MRDGDTRTFSKMIEPQADPAVIVDYLPFRPDVITIDAY